MAKHASEGRVTQVGRLEKEHLPMEDMESAKEGLFAMTNWYFAEFEGDNFFKVVERSQFNITTKNGTMAIPNWDAFPVMGQLVGHNKSVRS